MPVGGEEGIICPTYTIFKIVVGNGGGGGGGGGVCVHGEIICPSYYIQYLNLK